MKKSNLFLLGLIAVVLFAFGTSTAQAKPITLRLGHVVSTVDPWHHASLRFAEIVEKESDGKIKVEVYSDSQLGGEKDMAEGLQMGTVDMAVLGTGTLGKIEPKMVIFGLPFLFRDRDHLVKVLNGPVGQEIFDATCKSTGIRGLVYWERGARNLTNSKRAINIPADVKGLKLRTPGEEMAMDIWKALGAGPTPMAFGELFTALQQKVVDGQENPLATIASAKFDEVQGYLALTGHTRAPAVLAMSDRKFSKLSPDLQKVVMAAAAESAKYEAELMLEQEKRLVEDLQSKGMVVTNPDLKAFAEATKDVHLKYDSQYGKDLYEKIVNTK